MFVLGYINNPKSPSIIASKDSQLESDERLFATDLVCEGPIEGLCDKDGELLKYVTDETNNQVENLVLGKGVYYNNVPIVDSKLNKLNFVTAGFNISYGEEFNLYKNQYASTVHKYDRKIYLNDDPSIQAAFIGCDVGYFFFSKDEKGLFKEDNDKIENNPFVGFIRKNAVFSINGVFNGSKAVQFLDTAKKNCQEFNHKIVNKYADEISIHIRANQLFSTSNDGTVTGGAVLAFELSEENSIARYFGIISVSGISKSGYTIDIPLALNLNSVTYNNYYVKVYALSQKIPPSNGRDFKDFSVTGIVERVKSKGNFSYPFSSIVKSSVSSRHFNEDPDRSFDLKLLKIKVPSNYDPESREYSGNWNGKFSSFLRWTDNPAWIFYDICTNSRYGIGNGLVLEKDLNKWDLYKIAKYSDELIKIATPNKYEPDDFYIEANNPNIIYVDKKGRNINDFKKQYPPVSNLSTSFANENGGYSNSIIFLYNLKNDLESIDNAYKKIIWSVEDNGSTYKIKLINDFGPRSFFEKDTTGLLNLFSAECAAAVQNNVNKTLTSRISDSLKNSQSNAKNFILRKFSNSIATYSSYIEEQIFPDDFYYDSIDDKDSITLIGKCLPKVLNYRDPFEPRFSCNLLIDNETDALKILNDIASIFRGITYYKNNLVTATIDVDKPIAYLFNNANVKNGSFSYSTGSLDGNYSVAKVLYKDRYENFTEQVEIVEDYQLIRNYGIVVKEILGFGITSKDQARRIGQWLLLTNRFENQTVTFSTDLQGIVLRPSDVIQIEDQYKNNNILQGRVIDVNYTQKYIVVDRQLNLNLTGQKIKFICDKLNKTISELNDSSSVSDSDIEATNVNQVIELKIERIENNNSRIYLDTSFNYNLFNSILKTTPFIIEDRITNQKENLYKIVTITEAENNEYTLFCIKHDPAKYEGLTNFTFENKVDFSNNTIAYAISDTISQIKVSGINFYETSTYSLNQLASVTIDYTFNEPKSSLIKSSAINAEYWVLNLKINDLFTAIQTLSASNTYYKGVQNVLNDHGGILFKIILRNQNIKFYMKKNDISDKKIFLGKFGGSPIYLSGSCEVQLYLFDKTNKIINVDL